MIGEIGNLKRLRIKHKLSKFIKFINPALPECCNFLSEGVKCVISQKKPPRDSTNSTAQGTRLFGIRRW